MMFLTSIVTTVLVAGAIIAPLVIVARRLKPYP